MGIQTCATVGCSHRVKTGLVRNYAGDSGRTLADGRHCWRCRQRMDRQSGIIVEVRRKAPKAKEEAA